MEETDKKRFFELMHKAAVVPKGKEIMEQLSVADYSICFQPMRNGAGMCNPDSKTICLNAFMDSNELLPTLIHEAVHAIQFNNLKQNANRLVVADYIKLNKAAEADAYAQQAAFVFQAKDVYPDVYQREIQKQEMQAFVAEFQESGSQSKAEVAAFRAWYQNDNQIQSYENHQVAELKFIVNNGKKDFTAKVLSERISDVDVAKFCLTSINADFFKQHQAKAISFQTKQELTKIGDSSIQGLPVRNNKNSLTLSSFNKQFTR